MTTDLPATIQAVRIHQFGGPEQLQLDTLPLPTYASKQVLVRIEYAGLNYIDTYHRTGLYPNPLPLTLGREGSGVVVAAGADVDPSIVAVGDRVTFLSQGSYATYTVVDQASIIRVPDGISNELAAAALLQGLTVQYLSTSSYHINAGDVVLIHAVTGGTGGVLAQVAKFKGATVIGTVGSAAKEQIAKQLGVDHVINYQTHDFLEEVRKLYPEGVHVVYDGVGKTTFDRSLRSLRKLGTLVSFGNASGPVPAFNPIELSRNGSLTLVRPTLFDYVATRDALISRSNELFEWLTTGKLNITIAKVLPLAEAAEAHRLLEGRSLSGKILLKL